MKIIALISNLRMLLIFMLLNLNDLESTYFIFDTKFNCDIKLKKLVLPKEKNIFQRGVNIFLDYFTLKKKHFSTKIKVYGADHIRGANFFLKRFDFYLIEDGTMNYIPKTYIRSIKNILFSKPKFGVYKNVKKIYLTGLAPIPSKIEKKVEIINLNELWKNKTIREKEKILGIFGFNNKIIKSIKERSIILYTQPLSEDGVISEKEKIELYSKIILKYPKEKLILKTHPREITQYKKLFKDILILDQNFPSEILELLEIKFEKGVTLFSTAVLNAKVKEIDFYGTEVHIKLLEKFGRLDSIIKRNCFLD